MCFDQMFGSELNKLYNLDDIDFGAAEEIKRPLSKPALYSEFDKMQRERITKTFMLHNRGPRH